MNLILKKTTEADLETLFIYQTDEASNLMAAFTPEDPNDKTAYMDKWTKIIHNPAINMQTIFIDGKNVGSVVHFDMMGETNVSYWIGRAFWAKGFASKALKLFLKEVKKRPLVGRVAFDNKGSQKVLEKCGFIFIRKENEFANARKEEIDEFVYRLD